MADIVFNVAKGRVAYYATLPAANDALIVVPIETSGIETDETLRDHDTLASLLAGSSNEQTTMGRKVMTGVTVTVSDTPGQNWVSVDANDVLWTAVTGNAISALVICYDPDTTTGSDTDLIPLVKLQCPMTPDGTDFLAEFAVDGFFRAT